MVRRGAVASEWSLLSAPPGLRADGRKRGPQWSRAPAEAISRRQTRMRAHNKSAGRGTRPWTMRSVCSIVWDPQLNVMTQCHVDHIRRPRYRCIITSSTALTGVQPKATTTIACATVETALLRPSGPCGNGQLRETWAACDNLRRVVDPVFPTRTLHHYST